MRVGIFFQDNQTGGGIFQYSLNVLTALSVYSHKYEVSVVTDNPAAMDLIGFNVGCNVLRRRNHVGKAITVCSMIGLKIPRLFFNSYDALTNKVDLIIFPYPSYYAAQMKMPYVVSIHDLMHKVYSNLPEFSIKKNIGRDRIYRNCAKSSVVTIVDSELGREHVIKFLGIQKDKIEILPFIPQSYAYDYANMTHDECKSVLEKFILPDQYLFYPAQFWSHKNHINLLKAIQLLERQTGERVNVVFSGSPKDNTASVAEFINTNCMSNVLCVGYVNNKQLIALYKMSKALVYPSLFGPTNIPPLEAMALGIPVLCSNVFSVKEQLGDAALYFDPYCIEDIAEKILVVMKDDNLRERLIKNGKNVTDKMTMSNYAKSWEEIVGRFSHFC